MVQKVPDVMVEPSVPTAVINLPAASMELQGVKAFVTDAASIIFGDVVVGGGVNIVPIYCDGVDWRVG